MTVLIFALRCNSYSSHSLSLTAVMTRTMREIMIKMVGVMTRTMREMMIKVTVVMTVRVTVRVVMVTLQGWSLAYH